MIFLSHVGLTSTGPIGVSIFLVISGFCMTYAYIDKEDKVPKASVKNNLFFTVRKIKKLYPLHALTLALVALIIFADLIVHKVATKEIVEQGAYFTANALLIQSWIPWKEGYFSFNAVSWYLSTVAFSYFVFPWVFRVIQSKNTKRIIELALTTVGSMAAVSVILGIAQNKFECSNAMLKWVTYIFPVYRAGDFIIGLVSGYVFVVLKKTDNKIRCTIVECVVIILMIIQVIIYTSGSIHATNWMLSLFWLPTSVILVYSFAANNGSVSHTLCKSKTLIWLGNISGEAFLIHQIAIKFSEIITKNKYIVAIISFTATIVCTVIWRFIYKKVKESISNKKLSLR